MPIQLYNTMTKEIEEFKPITENEVSMYHCGPTVYDYLHIGNMRTYVFADTLRRMFEFSNYTVHQVINITDVGHLVSDADEGEDKMEKAAAKNNKSAKEIAEFFTDIFHQDLEKLNIRTLGTKFPKVTDNIPEQIEMITKLEAEGHTYKTSDGIYFDVSTFPAYGKLGDIDLKGLQAGNRVEFNEEKRTAYDFALWKFSHPNEKRQQEWDSPWGVGFPGWHIECSVMAKKYLGDTFDIHTGGIDHIPVHHNNEIAQSESANHAELAHVWMHGAFLNWKDKKMSKSDGTFITLADLEKQGIHPLSYRYFVLQTKYRQPIFFDIDDIQASQTAFGRLKNKINEIISREPNTVDDSVSNEKLKFLIQEAANYIQDDLNTPKVVAYLWEVVKGETILAELTQKDFKTFVEQIDSILGLMLLEKTEKENIPDEILAIQKERDIARQNKDWAKADELRETIKKHGFDVLDKANESVIVKI